MDGERRGANVAILLLIVLEVDDSCGGSAMGVASPSSLSSSLVAFKTLPVTTLPALA